MLSGIIENVNEYQGLGYSNYLKDTHLSFIYISIFP